MTALLVRRLIALIPLLLGISVILFILTHLQVIQARAAGCVPLSRAA